MVDWLVWGLVGVVAVMAVVIVIMISRSRKLRGGSDGAVASMLKQDITELSRTVAELNESFGDRMTQMSEKTATSLEKQFAESGRIVSDVSARLAKFEETNKRVVSVADELKTLQNVLQNPKQRGVFGEFYLESVLQNVLATSQYQMQYKFRNGDLVDAVIFLDKGKILPIDSKFSLENYNRMVNEGDKARRDELMKVVKNDLKSRIDETAKYIRPNENTMDFAFMFIPSEALYYDLLIAGVGAGASGRDLIEYAFRDRKVIIVSPTSFMAYLQTVLQGLRSLRIEKDAREIQGKVAKLGGHIAKFEEYLMKLGKSLDTTVNAYNSTHKELEKIDKDIVSVAGGERQIEAFGVNKTSVNEE
ncbi:DNA recombination protein RmuC [Candidatus Saccharibacteria bacterium]|nr:DNA recombination protein RmuC [Candidatus Saccharibacteria bacterium]